MIINKINSFQQISKLNKAGSYPLTGRLSQDVFEHTSSVSFGQKFNHDYYDTEFQTAFSHYLSTLLGFLEKELTMENYLKVQETEGLKNLTIPLLMNLKGN